MMILWIGEELDGLTSFVDKIFGFQKACHLNGLLILLTIQSKDQNFILVCRLGLPRKRKHFGSIPKMLPDHHKNVQKRNV